LYNNSSFLFFSGSEGGSVLVFNQVRQGRISDNIVAQVKDAILTGIYRPGDKLPSEMELRKLFNVSRVPLREALRSLEEMGFIAIKSGVLGGAFVAEMGTKSVSDSLCNMMTLGKISIQDVWQFRMVIEPKICRLAAAQCTEWDIQQMEDTIAIRENALKAKKMPVVSDIDFHHAIVRATKNPLLILIMDSVGQNLQPSFKRLNFSLADHQSINNFHKKILAGIKKKDVDKIEKLMHDHLLDVKRRLDI
jgi:GntR family transcriptional regulator, transcriptional repressor for pyruvate dehydrogenase complex